MWTSKKFRRSTPNGLGGDASSQPMVFSDDIPENNLDFVPATEPPTRSQTDDNLFTGQNDLSSPITDDATNPPAYQDDENNISRPPRARNSMRSTASSMWYKTRDKVSNFNVPRLAAPWEHELTEKDEINGSPSATIRDFHHRRQRRRLFINGTFQWAITAAICLGLFATLFAYSRFTTVDQNQKHIFTALMTFLSILLGLNLASSLAGYAQMMRWRLLAAKYRNLQDFELIMNSDSQEKVFRLLWAGRDRNRWWFPNKTQLLCFTWLVINMALQVFTALLGLTYSVDVSDTWVRIVWGNVSIVDLSSVREYGDNSTNDSFDLQGGSAHLYGIEGQDYPLYLNIPDDQQTYSDAYYSTTPRTSMWYRFIDQNPNDATETSVSARTVTTTATCQEFEVLAGGYPTSDFYVTYFDTNLGENATIWVPLQATSCATWMSNPNSTCGPRCTNTMMLLAADYDPTSVPKPLLFSCNNTVGTVTNTDQYAEPDSYQMPDIAARAWAGSIGFSGIYYTPLGLQYVLFDSSSQWSPNGQYTVNNVTTWANDILISHLVMQYTAGGLAADDSNGPRINVDGLYPVQAQVVDVTWTYAIALLAGIPGFQFLVLLIVLVFANKVIIKDTSHLATARLLRPVVEKLGSKGCLLTGDEIARELGNYRLKYGVRDPPQSSMAYSGLGGDFVRHLDVIEEDEGLGREDARMRDGLYDGTSTWGISMEEHEPLLKKRSGRRLSI